MPDPALVAATAAVAAAGLAISATGSMVVAAVLLGVAARDRWSGLAAVLAVAAVAVRFGTTDFGDVAGIQSVLGAAGLIGPTTAAASAWAAAAAVLLAVAPRPTEPPTGHSTGSSLAGATVGPRTSALLLAVAAGAVSAAIVAGPGPGGELVIRIGATVGAVLLSLGIGRARRSSRLGTLRVALAVVAGLAALVLAGWPT